MIYDLPDKLHTLRIKYGYSQKAVAEKLHVSPSIISGYETGERTPSLEMLLALSTLYYCSTDYLLGKQVQPPDVYLNAAGLTEPQITAIQNLIESIKKAK